MWRFTPQRRHLGRIATESWSRQLSASPSVPQAYVRRPNLAPKGRKRKKAGGSALESSRRVAAIIMPGEHDQFGLAQALRARFGAGSVQVFGGSTSALSATGMLKSSEVDAIEDVVHLSAPASGTDAPHGSARACVFFFTASSGSDGPSRSACVSVWWGSEPNFEDALLRDLLALQGGQGRGRHKPYDPLSLPREVMKWHTGDRSELSRDEILINAACEPRKRTLDQLSFSHALHRHMKLLLLEDEMERILGSVKRIVRQGRPSLFLRFLPPYLGGVESGARTMQRLLLMREFNFDDSIMSTPDWLWEQPEREAMYDAMVSEYEIEDRIEAINQQLDYAQATMQTLKDDAQHQHSTFLEYAIVLLIAFEVLVEIHSLG